MLANPTYRSLHNLFLEKKNKLIESLCNANNLQQQLAPLNHELSSLQWEVEKNLTMEQRILDIELAEQTEKVILDDMKSTCIKKKDIDVIKEKNPVKIEIVDRNNIMRKTVIPSTSKRVHLYFPDFFFSGINFLC
jgi:hypothetical protein